jgi:thioredoxin reductase
LAQKLGLSLKAERSFYELIIVGNGPAALTASIYAAREGIDCLIIEKSALGGQAGVTDRIDNYPGFPDGIAGAELVDRIIRQARRYGVSMLSAVAVRSVDRDGEYLCVTTEGEDKYGAKAVVVATGSTYRRLGVPGEDDLIGAGVHFCATCDGPFYRGSKELMVNGGGNSGVEEGLFLTQFTDKVVLLEYNSELKASALLQEKARSHPKMEIHTNTEVIELRGENGKLSAVIAAEPGDKRNDGVPPGSGVCVHRADAEQRVPEREDQPGPLGLHRDRADDADVDGGSLRGGRRPGGQHEAARERGRRGRGGADPGAPVPAEAGRCPGVRGGGATKVRGAQVTGAARIGAR